MQNQDITLDTLLKEIVKNRNEIKNSIEASETRLLLTIEDLKKKTEILENENQALREKIEFLERSNKKNNIIVFGLNKENKIVTPEFVLKELNRRLDVNLVCTDLNNVYAFGHDDNKPIKVEFISNLKKAQVIKNSYKLKGTEISIVQDQTLKQRQDYKLLKKHLNLAKQDKNNKCYIKKNKLHVNEEVYTIEDLDQYQGADDNTEVARPSSAPSTPNKHLQQLEEDIDRATSLHENTTTRKLPESSKQKPSRVPAQQLLGHYEKKMKLRSNSITTYSAANYK